MIKQSIFAVSLFLLVSCQKKSLPQSYAIKVSNWFDGHKIHRGRSVYVRVEGKRIGKITSDPPRRDIPIVDLGRKFLIPGLVDGHTHIFFEDKRMGRNFSKAIIDNLKNSVGRRIEYAKTIKREYLKAGFTTLLDLGNSGAFLDVRLRDREGDRGPILYVSGPGVAIKNAQLAKKEPRSVVEKEYRILSFKRPLKPQLNDYLVHNVDVLKIFGDNDPSEGILTIEEINKVADWAHKNGLQVHLHATNPNSVARAFRSRVDLVHHVYGIDQKSLEIVSKSKKSFVPTYFNNRLHQISAEARERDGQKENQLKLFSFKDQIGFGSDVYISSKSGMDRGEQAIEALISYLDFGLTPIEVLKSATSFWTDKFPPYQAIGVIKKGAFANMVVVDGSLQESLEPLRNVKHVIFKGKFVAGGN
jgi:imidazolonepropionase-like amidohydrolase